MRLELDPSSTINFARIYAKGEEGEEYGIIVIHIPPDNPGVAILSSIDTLKEKRNAGIGGGMLQRAEEWAKNNGAQIIVGDLGLEQRVKLKEWYRKRGYEVDEFTIQKEL